MSYETLRWDQDGNVATVTLDRPEKKNAMSWAMFEELGEVFRRAGEDDSVRCLVVTGAGGSFCSGADLTDPANMVATSADFKRRMGRINEIAREVITCPVPTVARVTGVAAGAGCNLALCCDFVVATRSSSFAELFVKRGLVVDFGGTWALTRLLPLNRAKEIAMLGDTLTAAEAFELGLVNRLCEDAEVDVVVKDLAGRLAGGPPATLALIKESFNRALERSVEEVLDAEGLAQTLCFTTADTREAITAWIEKREPRFSNR